MANLSLSIETNFDEALRQFRVLTQSAEKARDEIRNFFGSFNVENMRSFIDSSIEAAGASDKYKEAQRRLGTALSDVGNQITNNFLPRMTNVVGKVTDSITSFDTWEGKIKVARQALTGLSDGLTEVMGVNKVTTAISSFAELLGKIPKIVSTVKKVFGKFVIAVGALKTAFAKLTIVMKKNPIGAIAVIITAVLIPALIALFKNWDKVQTFLQQGIAHLQFAFRWLGSVIKEKFIIAFNTVRAAGATLIDFIVGNIIRAVGQMLDVMGRLPGVGRMFQNASQAVKRMGDAIGDMASEARAAKDQAIATARAEREETNKTLRANLNAINEASRARRAELQERTEIAESAVEMTDMYVEKELKIIMEAEQERMVIAENAVIIREQLLDEELKIIMEAENEKYELYKEYAAKMVEIKYEAYEAVKEMQDEVAENEEFTLKQRVEALSQFSDGFGDLLGALGRENRAFAIASRAIAMAEAKINTFLAFTRALNSGLPPWNLIAAGGVLAAGVAKQIRMASTPIPSAETGGRFIVPDVYPVNRVDSALMRVNPGEEVNVTPRGSTGDETAQYIFQINDEVIFDIVSQGISSGKIRFEPMANL